MSDIRPRLWAIATAAGLLSAVACGAAGRVAIPSPAPSSVPATPSPAAPSGAATVIGAGSPDRRAVALVFEVGEGADDAAPAFLATLRAQRVRATFAVTGRWAEAHRDLLISIAADGHQIVNGTYDGASFTGTSTGTPPLSPSQRALELSRAEVSVYHFTQRSTRPYFFPPYGDVDGAVLRDAAAAGYTRAIVPALDSDEWRAEAPADLDVRAVAAAHPGAIFLLHIDDQSPDADALAGIIDGLRGAGYALETVDELVAPP